MSDSDRLLDQITLHRVGLERYATGMTRDIVKILDEAAEEIEGRLARDLAGIEERGFRMSMGQRERLKKVLARIRDIMEEANEVIRAEMTGDLKALAQHEAEFARKLYDDGMQLGSDFTTPAPQLLAAIVSTDPFQGEVLKDWASKMEANQIERIRRSINLGLVQGESIPQIVKRLKGTGPKGKGGVFSTNRGGAEALVRTAVNHVSNRSHYMVLERNPTLFKQYRWISVLDNRTTPICRSRAGTVYRMGEGPIPPAHWNCRSTIAPIVPGMDNQSHPQYDEWLRRQPVGVQDDILGKTRGRLFRDGQLPMRGFVSRSGEELTLKELKAREHDAWKRAFGERSPAP